MTNNKSTTYFTHAPGPTAETGPEGPNGSKRLISRLRSRLLRIVVELRGSLTAATRAKTSAILSAGQPNPDDAHRRHNAPSHPVYRLPLPTTHEPAPSAPHQSSSTAHTGSVVGERMSGASWALVSGGAGLVSGLFLVMFYAVGQPLAPVPSRWIWLGPANDLSSAVQAAALIPVALEGGRLLPDPYVRRWTRIGVSAMIAGSILPVLLLAGLIPFAVQTPLVIAAFAAIYGWVFTINRAAARRQLVRLTVANVGIVSALGLGVALAAAGVGALLPAQSTAQSVTGGIAVVAGVIAWLGFPLWTLLVWARPCTPAGDERNA